jgi:hypothetical protein
MTVLTLRVQFSAAEATATKLTSLTQITRELFEAAVAACQV